VPGDQLSRLPNPAMSRRRFIAGVGAAVASSTLLGVVSGCGGAGNDITSLTPTGAVRGTVVDMNGQPQSVGRVYLLQKNGFNAGVYADVDAMGKFDFGGVEEGPRLLRFWGGNQASVPEPLHNPVPITVAAATPVDVKFQVVLGQAAGGSEQEIYIGEFFFQEQPVGRSNDVTVVKLGTTVCWYNVGQMIHDVTGGPWGTSGPIGVDGNFMWTSNQVGTFPYRCSYHGTQMIATLQVVP
jgi:plastocyanin